MRQRSATFVSVIALGIGLGVAACRDTQPTASASSDPRSVSASLQRSAQAAPAGGNAARWKPALTVTTTPGENGSASTSFDFEEAQSELLVGDLYAEYGLHFQNASAYNTFFASDYYPSHSGITVVTATIPRSGNGGDGAVVVTFDSSVTSFGAYATSAMPLTLSCFDAQGATVGAKDLQTPNLNDGKSPYAPNHKIEVEGEGIVRCTFTGSNNYYVLDDFEVQRTAAGVTCDPSSPRRGEKTTCTAAGFVVVNAWSFMPDSNGLPEVRDSVPGNEPEWSGSVVMSGTVHVFGWHKVEDAFVRPRDSASVHVEVQPRTDWVPFKMPDSVEYAGQGPTSIIPAPNDSMMFGAFRLIAPDNWTAKTALSGPNKGYTWIDSEPPLPRSKVYLSPALDGEGAWAARQVGEYGGKKKSPKGLPYCNQENLKTFKAVVERHEGLTHAANSHYGLWNRELATSDIHMQTERIVVASTTAAEDTAQRTRDRVAASQQAYNLFQNWREQKRPIQANFDSTEYVGNKIPALAGGCDWVPMR